MIRVVAEAGMCNNDIDWAFRAVDAAADAGCWGFKVQLLQADWLAAASSPRYDRLAGPATQHEAFRDALPYEAWERVQERCVNWGLEFFASAWDLEALEVLRDLGCTWIKVGSADITYRTLIETAATMFPHLVLSTGAAALNEVEQAIGWVYGAAPEIDLTVMACTLSYPTDAYDARLVRIHQLAHTGKQVGYSDHTRQTDTSGFAVAAGASMLEKHMTLPDTVGTGGDHDFALIPSEMSTYVYWAKHVEALLGGPTDSAWTVIPAEHPARTLARRSLHTVTDVPEGDPIIVGGNVRWLRPAGGIEPSVGSLAGYVATSHLPPGVQVEWGDIRQR